MQCEVLQFTPVILSTAFTPSEYFGVMTFSRHSLELNMKDVEQHCASQTKNMCDDTSSTVNSAAGNRRNAVTWTSCFRSNFICSELAIHGVLLEISLAAMKQPPIPGRSFFSWKKPGENLVYLHLILPRETASIEIFEFRLKE